MAKAKLGSGTRFNAIKQKVAHAEEKKGVSKKKAEADGAATAANAGRKAHGQKAMTNFSKKGRSKK